MRAPDVSKLHIRGGGQGRNHRGGAYNHRKWRRRRRYQLMQQPLCEICLAEGRVTVANVVHHTTDHRGDRAEFFYGAVQSLCREHHERLHGRTNDNPWIGEDGLPLPQEQQAERERQRMAKRLWEDNDDSEVG
jgi:hypothetical protein